jgi:hypothetical protein
MMSSLEWEGVESKRATRSCFHAVSDSDEQQQVMVYEHASRWSCVGGTD